ncbi:Abi family protein [Corynebacterium lizhenjunii]|uniref:Abi family protein n=1 Tax=Corynebacterium lizhenjunii TaxID=2709394 RepID=UPI0013ED4B76|nr:Abi family protein [Corynebacterium lizhenjunii]
MKMNQANQAFGGSSDRWFSPERMHKYRQVLPSAPEDLYVWNAKLSKAYLVDLQHIEVALRNVINRALVPEFGRLWFNYRYPESGPQIAFRAEAKKSIDKAIKRSQWSADQPPGMVIAELTFDFWYYLLSAHYRPIVWPKVLRQLSARADWQEFHGQVRACYWLRNRVAHHEPLIKADYTVEMAYLDEVSAAISQVARWIDPALDTWVHFYSDVATLHAQRPVVLREE